MEKKQHIIDNDDSDIRFDRWVRRHYPGLSYVYILKAIRKGLIKLDGKKFKPEDKVSEGQVVTLAASVLETKVSPEVASEDQVKTQKFADRGLQQTLLKSIIYQDDDLIILNKPAGLAVQGGTGIKHSIDELAEYLKFDYDMRPKLVHRLDKDTSGVLLLARKTKIAAELAALFKNKYIEKKYLAIVHGVPKEKSGTIEGDLVKAWEDGFEKVTNDSTDKKSKKSLTLYRVLDYVHQKAALVEFIPVTGRTHQLRIHAKMLGHAIVGDDKYGDREKNKLLKANRHLYLHAYFINLPYHAKFLQVTAPIPKHMKDLMGRLSLKTKY